MTYAASDHWPLKDGLRIGHLNINHLINKMSDVNPMAGVFVDDKDKEDSMLLGKIHKIRTKLASLSMFMKLRLLHVLLSLKSMG